MNIESATAHNRTVYASPPLAARGSVRLGQSLRSFPRLTPPTVLQGYKPTVCLFALQNRRIQPERCNAFLYVKVKIDSAKGIRAALQAYISYIWGYSLLDR
jgi:hypothetical protein